MDTKQLHQIIEYIDSIEECMLYSNFPLMDEYINGFMISYTKCYMDIISMCQQKDQQTNSNSITYWANMTNRILETIKSKDAFAINDLLCFELRDKLIKLVDGDNKKNNTDLVNGTINPYSIEVNYNLGEKYYALADYKNALKFYLRAKAICEKRRIDIIDKTCLNQKIDESSRNLKVEEKEIIEKQIEYAVDDPFRKITALAGDFYIDEDGNKAYVGLYNDWGSEYCGGADKPANYEYEIFWTDSVGNAKQFNIDGDYIVPVVGRDSLNTEESWIRIDEVGSGTSSMFPMLKQKSYSYFRLHGKCNIAATNNIVFGKPISLKHKNKKKLVINLFIDSFNHRIFDFASESGNFIDGLSKLMPNTYKFFKEGVICSNAFSDSEWTTPSLSSYWTGMYSHKHMNVDENIWWSFPKDTKVLPEYFKDAGYMTCRLGENQESANPSQGYMRGMDRFVSRQGHSDAGGFISETIDQIEAFKDTDQFLLVTFEDLHKIAGNMESGISIQANTPVNARQQDNEGTTTVKQGRSLNKQLFFEKELTRIDRNLGILFDYLKNNYDKEEYVVGLFSDHGTAFLVEDDQPMICEQRTHIPMMFYSSEFSGVCDEFIQNVDYGEILCKLTGIEYCNLESDSILPKFFGGKESREYALSQTIYIGDPYQAMIRGKNFTYYYKTDKSVDKECRIYNDLVEEKIIDDNGNTINSEVMKNYRSIIESNLSHLI